MKHVRTLVGDPDRSTIKQSGRETLVAVQLEHLLWRHRTQLSCSGLSFPTPEPINQHDSAAAAQDQPTPQERVLALVAAIANGEEHCLLRLRVSRAIFADLKAGILEREGPPSISIHRALNSRILIYPHFLG